MLTTVLATFLPSAAGRSQAAKLADQVIKFETELAHVTPDQVTQRNPAVSWHASAVTTQFS